MNNIYLQQSMTDSQKMMFQNELSKVEKNPTTAILLALFLGGLGAHHFYMGKVGLGILYIIFCWTCIPSIIAFIELFLLSSRVRDHNDRQAEMIAAQVKSLY